ncbi:hypothetical protein [Devosia sp. A449]
MMFSGKKPGAEKPPVAAGPGGDPWDQKTLEWFTKLDRISLRITHIERRYKAGPGAPWGVKDYGNPETIATGFLNEAPQHVHIEIEFKDASPEFGSAYLTYQMDVDHTSGPINMPVMKISVLDTDHAIKTGLLESLRDAVSAGESVAQARIWATPTEGRWETVEGGHNRCLDVTGMIVWVFTKSPRLQSWAMPIGEQDLTSYPDPRQLRSKPKE